YLSSICLLLIRRRPSSTLFPYTTLFRSLVIGHEIDENVAAQIGRIASSKVAFYYGDLIVTSTLSPANQAQLSTQKLPTPGNSQSDRKSTRLNSSHSQISYAVFCLKKKKK